MMKGQVIASDDVDVGLGELPIAPFLGPLTPPRLLYLEAPEREVELAGVLEHVAGQGHGEVVVQAEAGVAGIVAGLQRRRTYTALSISPLRSNWSSGSAAR